MIAEIEKNVPLAPRRRGKQGGRPRLYNFAHMGVGDSFNVLVGDRYAPNVRSTVQSCAYQFRKRHAPVAKRQDVKDRIPHHATPALARKIIE